MIHIDKCPANNLNEFAKFLELTCGLVSYTCICNRGEPLLVPDE